MIYKSGNIVSALAFLSLDTLQPIMGELGAPWASLESFQNLLRPILRRSIQDESYFTAPENLSGEILGKLHDTFGSNFVKRLENWASEVYLHDNNRASEECWLLVLAKGAQQNLYLEPSLYDKINFLNEQIKIRKSILKRKFYQLTINNWDAEILSALYTNSEDIYETSIWLCSLNILNEEWEKIKNSFLEDDLKKIYNWGCKINNPDEKIQYKLPMIGCWNSIH